MATESSDREGDEANDAGSYEFGTGSKLTPFERAWVWALVAAQSFILSVMVPSKAVTTGGAVVAVIALAIAALELVISKPWRRRNKQNKGE